MDIRNDVHASQRRDCSSTSEEEHCSHKNVGCDGIKKIDEMSIFPISDMNDLNNSVSTGSLVSDWNSEILLVV